MEFSTHESFELSIQNYFKNSIKDQIFSRFEDSKLIQMSDEYQEIIQGIENDLRKRLVEFQKLSKKFHLSNPGYFLEEWLNRLPRPTHKDLVMTWGREVNPSPTKSKTDFRISIRFLFMIDIYEQNNFSLDWFKHFISSQGELFESFKDEGVEYIQIQKMLPAINRASLEKNRWKTTLRQSLERSLFPSVDSPSNINKAKLDNFYDEMRKSNLYTWDGFENMAGTECFDLEMYYYDYLLSEDEKAKDNFIRRTSKSSK
ncbi:hypothetical protein [Peredibacter starrii]|uniref:Uncharacterized protein n=1 Tax=Peredibacter starrii TaxID=28202 RepID=A0AAX4HR89_9BACT|nr:hypothetical protein [Peredibacter starrii]WPU65893.1 hypothetical protein SOO65_03960 [Peredibacter starrii]